MSDKYKYRVEIQQMMFVSGETNDPPVEATCLIEDIVRAQVVELLLQASTFARKRGARAIAVEDLIFVIRHDKAKVNRLSTYLLWKDARKNAREQDGGGVDGADLIEDSGVINNEAKKASRTSKIRFPWEMAFMFSEQPLDDGEDDGFEAEAELEAGEAMRKRLRKNDERTKNMTKEEYGHWSECRQATFTYRKAKRFREWVGISQFQDFRPHDDIMDVLGFLTFEIVANITEEALKVKELEEELELKSRKGNQNPLKRKREHHLFDGPDEVQRPIMARHVQEAYRRFQMSNSKAKALRKFTGGLVSMKMQMI